ncbi:MAG: ornithine cyclodeaminase [Cyclobacteriaceae bacterium]|nr:ornithine cyclodeaminase [Cyclobacteriaceae bacterium]
MKQISTADIQKKISMRQAIDLMKEAFSQLSLGNAVAPVRTVMNSSDDSGRVLFMPSYSSAFGLFGLKMVSVFDHNTSKKLPVIQGHMMIMDGNDGTPLASIEAEYLTELRTGAASGLATDLLARKHVEVLAIFGTGTQAETQLEGVLMVRSVQEVIVFGTHADKVFSFCRRMKDRFDINIVPSESFDELREADIICTATTCSQPLFQEHQLKRGVHINGIGSYKPSMQEIPSDVIKRSLLVVDHREAALTEPGDIVIPVREGIITKDHIHAEIGEIVNGSKRGRTSEDEITVFKSVGNAIQDLAIAGFMIDRDIKR